IEEERRAGRDLLALLEARDDLDLVAGAAADLHRPRLEVAVALCDEHDLLRAGIEDRVRRDRHGYRARCRDLDRREETGLEASAWVPELEAHLVRPGLL